jgi:benzylsuccinate CoA-transferase BbsF subunit
MAESIVARKKPLAGIRVLDFSWFAAGPAAAKLLAGNGAEVIKVESLERPDNTRGMQPKLDPNSPNSSLYFNNMNTDKYSVALNLTDPKGLDVAKRLVKISDLVITNFSPRAIDKLGLGYEALRQLRDDIIVVHMPMLGLTGRKRHYAGFGTGLKGITGLSSRMGFEGTMPVGPQGAYPDFGINPSHAALACLAALYYRRKTGKGQLIDMSQYESVVNVTGTAVLEFMVNGRVPARRGNRHPERLMAPHGVYSCKGEDRWVAIAIEDDGAWRRFCDAGHQIQLGADPRFSTLVGRLNYEDELDERITTWTQSRTPSEIAKVLQAADVAAYPVQTAEDLFEHDEQMTERRHYTWLNHAEIGLAPVDRPAFRFRSFSAEPERAAPLVGEHTDYVLRDLLGLSLEEVNQMIVEGIVTLG